MLPAVILCGGLGTRLRSLVADRPKVLALVRGEPFLSYLLQNLRRQGIGEVILSTGYLGEQVESFVGDGSRWGMRVRCIRERERLGTGGALRYVVEQTGIENTFLAMNGDTFFDGSLAELLRFHRTRPDAVGTISLVEVPNSERYGFVKVSLETGEILSFEEKSSPPSGRHAWISAGVYVLEPSLLEPVAPGTCASIEQDVFPRWVGKGLYGRVFPEARFLDIGVPEDLERAEQLLAGP